ncbi:MAG: 30S ribosomal protein S6 [Phycisphaeraceae bacterium]|nr:MAG: 30S ribosomal protein S6 [Phycisphaeraceae bacterium]
MAETKKNYYEGMFLFGQSAAADLGGTVEHLTGILDRAQAEIVAMSKWDDRRLAFEIKKHKRGIYILVYFECDARNLAKIERDCNLSDHVLRSMVLRADHLTLEEMQASDSRQSLTDEAALRAEQPEDGVHAGVGAADDNENQDDD